MRPVLTIAVVLALIAIAGRGYSQGLMTLNSGTVSSMTVAQPSGKLLAVDAVSFILQTDGVSKICRAGGC